MQVIFQTRFGFVGNMGWRDDRSVSPDHVLNVQRLERQFFFFENITLTSVSDQTDDDFYMHILTSELLPSSAMARLVDLCDTYLGRERYTITAKPSGDSWTMLRDGMAEKFGKSTYAIQSSLDADDGVAVDFVELLRETATFAAHAPYQTTEVGHVNFVTGIRMDFIEEEIVNIGPDLRALFAPGTAMYGPLSANVPFLQQASLRRWPPETTSIMPKRPMYAKSFHDYNSRERRQNDPAFSDSYPAELDIYFPFLLGRLPG